MILHVTCWTLIPAVQSFQNSHFLLPSLHEGFFFPFPHRPRETLSKLEKTDFLPGLLGIEHRKALVVVMFLLDQPASWCWQQRSAAPGHWALQKCFPRWLNMLSHSKLVVFQMT